MENRVLVINPTCKTSLPKTADRRTQERKTINPNFQDQTAAAEVVVRARREVTVKQRIRREARVVIPTRKIHLSINSSDKARPCIHRRVDSQI